MQQSNNNYPTRSDMSTTEKQTQRIVSHLAKCRTLHIFSRLVNMATVVIKSLFTHPNTAPHTRPIKRDVYLCSAEAIHNWLAMVDRPCTPVAVPEWMIKPHSYSDTIHNDTQAKGGGASVGNSE